MTIEGVVVEQPTAEPTPTPTEKPTDGAGPPAPPDRPGGDLPRTGAAIGLLALVALLLLGAGAGAVRMRRATE
ncbi:MAG TPA: LPXTG cell wall anchor domain-containing protein [Phototrophicaceae bacterium]|nr:LPXTG cell wall anchor domain-containing protein [Phototrophicaceae bacterium]